MQMYAAACLFFFSFLFLLSVVISTRSRVEPPVKPEGDIYYKAYLNIPKWYIGKRRKSEKNVEDLLPPPFFSLFNLFLSALCLS